MSILPHFYPRHHHCIAKYIRICVQICLQMYVQIDNASNVRFPRAETRHFEDHGMYVKKTRSAEIGKYYQRSPE